MHCCQNGIYLVTSPRCINVSCGQLFRRRPKSSHPWMFLSLQEQGTPYRALYVCRSRFSYQVGIPHFSFIWYSCCYSYLYWYCRLIPNFIVAVNITVMEGSTVWSTVTF